MDLQWKAFSLLLAILAFSLLLALSGRASNAQRDIEKSTNAIGLTDAWDDLDDNGGDGSQNIFGGDFAKRDTEKSTNAIEWNDTGDDLEDDGSDGSQNIFGGDFKSVDSKSSKEARHQSKSGKGGKAEDIFGGDFIEPGSRPWLVPLMGKGFCAGSLISPSAVMTAASCVISPYFGMW